MKIIDNPQYKMTLDNIIHDEESKDLYEAIQLIDNGQTSRGDKVTDSSFTIQIDKKENTATISYMVDIDGFITTGYVKAKEDGTILAHEKKFEDLRCERTHF